MKYLLPILLFSLMACSTSMGQKTAVNEPLKTSTTIDKATKKADRPLAKFEPKEDKCLLFVGQELEAIGGLEEYNDGYLDHFKRPAGFTMYTNLSPNDISFGYMQKGLDGIWWDANWGDGVSNISRQLEDKDFDNMVLAIGLSMVNNEKAVATGKRDDLIEKMGEWFKTLGKRPIFLRIGYEFDGHSWNHYDREDYKKAFRHIKDKLNNMGCKNVACIWQSVGWVSSEEMLEEWYPGDAYVDWCGVSFFSRWDEIKMFDFARKKGKPVFIAEATPTISDYTVKFDGDTKETILSKPKQAEEAWNKWFVPFFEAIEQNKDIVKAVSYINCDWKSHAMWKNNKTFQDVDARLHLNKKLAEKWKAKVYSEDFIHSSEDLYDRLWSE